jgi:hypothetical protein
MAALEFPVGYRRRCRPAVGNLSDMTELVDGLSILRPFSSKLFNHKEFRQISALYYSV